MKVRITDPESIHFGHDLTVECEMDSYVTGVCSCDQYIYPYRDQFQNIDDTLLRIEVSMVQLRELEKQLALKVAQSVDSLVAFCDGLAARLREDG